MERSVVELAKDWRMDKYLRQLQAMLIVTNNERAYLISGTGDLIQPDDGILAIGSGGAFALAAARALVKHTSLTAAQIAKNRCASPPRSLYTTKLTVEPLNRYPTSRLPTTAFARRTLTPKGSCGSSTSTSSGTAAKRAVAMPAKSMAAAALPPRCETRSRPRT